jgi:hypothetical protein
MEKKCNCNEPYDPDYFQAGYPCCPIHDNSMQNKYPIGGYAPGNYTCICCICKKEFHGDKRAVQCEPCALAAKAKFDALSPAEQENVMKMNADIINNERGGFWRARALAAEKELQELKAGQGLGNDAHEKEIIMQAFEKVTQLFEGRTWIMDGRGSYPYNDDRYKEEVRYMYDEFEAIRKDTWANIHSKSVDYRKQIIVQYLQENPPQGAGWVNAALQYAKETIEFADKEFKCPDHLVETWCNMLLNTLHAIAQAQDESPSKESETVDPDELWDEFSEHIDTDIDSASTVAGSSVMTKQGFKKMMEKIQQAKK